MKDSVVTLNWSGYKKLTTENISILPTYAGVYKLTTYDAQTGKYNTPFYVGQADDIKARTQKHASPSEPNTCIKAKFDKYWVYLNYAAVSNRADRDAVEVGLYNHYKPDCNDSNALPDVAPTDVSSFN